MRKRNNSMGGSFLEIILTTVPANIHFTNRISQNKHPIRRSGVKIKDEKFQIELLLSLNLVQAGPPWNINW